MSETYRVDGMTCGGCARSVERAITEAVPEASVSVNLEAKTVTVDGSADAGTVEQAVEGAGFDFGGKV